MGIELTGEQAEALDAIKAFVRDDTTDAFILRGSAGTGKTTLIAKLVEALAPMKVMCTALAPTGRAARILGNKLQVIARGAGCASKTIHSEIYSLKQVEVNEEAESANDPGLRMIFPLRQDEPAVSLYIIDESSMVGDKESRQDLVRFGSGRLLADLVTFTRSKRPGRINDQVAKLLFVGDAVQLPPVGENASPALSQDYLQDEFGLRVGVFDLTTVMRQSEGSTILDHATRLRDAVVACQFNEFSLDARQPDLQQTDASGAVEQILDDLRNKHSSVAVVPSNAAALDYNRNIRHRLWGDADLPAQVGDILLVNKNSPTHMLNNGDLVKVVQIGAAETVTVSIRGGYRPELRFRDATVAFRAGDGSVVQLPCFLLENLLDSRERELAPIETRALLVHFRNRYPRLHPKSDVFRQTLKHDPYFNALQVKYGYAMTCHKAQGGEWDTAIVDFAAAGGTRNEGFFRWAYTAITRAKRSLVVVNPPNFSAISEIAWGAAATVPSAAQQPDLEELRIDPDWSRFSFSISIAPLMVVHQQLRSVWKTQDIEIEQLQHLQYMERYTLTRGDKRAVIQYYYDRKHRVGKSGVIPSIASDYDLANDALASIGVLGRTAAPNEVESFVSEFLAKLDTAIADSAIRRDGYESLPYRLRVTFSDGSRRGQVDFSYNGKSTWTSAQEVGGPGTTQGLYEEVQHRMAEPGGRLVGSREIFALRKGGHSEEALEMARAEVPENKDDIWFLRAYAWSLYDFVKTLVDSYKAKQLSGAALSGDFLSCMREFARIAKPLRGDLVFSKMLGLTCKVSKEWEGFLPFARWAGTDSFSEDDDKPFVTDDGKSIDCLKVRFTRAICRVTSARADDGLTDTELIEWGEGVLDEALQASPDDQWLNYYRSRLHLAREEHDLAIQRLMPVLQHQSRAAWPWALLGEILETARPDDALTCLIHAAQLARKEQEVAKLRIRLASRLAQLSRFGEAARQAQLATEYRTQNNLRVPQELQQLLASDWYKQVQAAGTSRTLPKVNAAAQKLLRELDQQQLIYALAVIDNINPAKALSYAATSASTGFVLKHGRFPEVANLAVGTVIEVGHAESDGQARDWRLSTVEAIPELYQAISGILERAQGKPFAFIRGPQNDVFVPPALAQRFSPGSSFEVTCKAVWRTNEKGKTGWRAVEVGECGGSGGDPARRQAP